MDQHSTAVETGNAAAQRGILLVFFFFVVIGGGNAVAVRFSNLELPPFWGAATRFAAAATIFWGIVLARRLDLPRGRSLAGVILFGFLAVGIAYALLYWALQVVPAGLTMMVLAFVPLLTFFFAIAHGLESFRWRGLLGALISIGGIAIAAGDALAAAVPLMALLAVIAAAFCMAEANVVFKLFPPVDPFVTNAIGTSVGALLLIIISMLAGETWIVPASATTWAAYLYLVLIGTVLLFYLYLFVLKRWTASATSYAFLLFPISAALIGAWLAGESISIWFIAGGSLVLAGVWVGVFSRARDDSQAKGQG